MEKHTDTSENNEPFGITYGVIGSEGVKFYVEKSFTKEETDFLKYIEDYLKSGNSIPVERVTLKASDIKKLLEIAKSPIRLKEP